MTAKAAPPSVRCRASAPVRLDFAGGWTDVAPFATEVGGVVVNAALDLRTHVEIAVAGESYILDSGQTGARAERSSGAWSGHHGTEFDLQKAALSRSGIAPCLLRTSADIPAGSGLGGSGALGVALVAALDAACGIERSPMALAEEAFLLEAVDAGLAGGRQDQYAAALGGFHQLSFGSDKVGAEPLTLAPEFAQYLADHLLICYTGTSRASSKMIARVMNAYRSADATVLNALHTMVDLAHRMSQALRSSNVGSVGDLLRQHWRCQCALDAGMRTPEMAQLEKSLDAAGALGGKAAGAGAGGSMFFLVRDRDAALAAAREAGADILPCRWSGTGIRTERY